VVALAPNARLHGGRALIGVAIGGLALRPPPPCAWCRNTRSACAGGAHGGNALASVVAAPLGSLLGAWVGWRGAFFCVVPVALATMAWQTLSLPALPARPAAESPIRWA
jgi:predicted MFS family arabinose efflux permease